MQHETQAEFERLHGDVEYFNSHYDGFLDQYPEQWVAIYNQEVVGAHAKHLQLLDDLEAKSIPLSKVVRSNRTKVHKVS